MSLVSILNAKRDKSFSKSLLDNVKTAHELREIISNFYIIDKMEKKEGKDYIQYEMNWNQSYLEFFVINATEESCSVNFCIHYASDVYRNEKLLNQFPNNSFKNQSDGHRVVQFKVTPHDLESNDKLMEQIASALEFFKCQFKLQSNKHDVITTMHKKLGESA